jgi:hypothetical protein
VDGARPDRQSAAFDELPAVAAGAGVDAGVEALSFDDDDDDDPEPFDEEVSDAAADLRLSVR